VTSVDSNISFPSGDKALSGYLARPDGEGPFPAVVVIHEANGITDNIRNVTQRLVEEGYIAFAADLFAVQNRAVCMARLLGGMIFNSLDHSGIHDLKAALTFLTKQPGVDSTWVGAIGFCMGRSFAIAWACTDSRLKAIAPYYAMNPRPLAAVARLCPVVGSYPADDFTAQADWKLDIELDKYQIPHDIAVYPGAKHSFFNEQGRNYNAAAAQDSWRRVLAFFKERLG
jgi:carboxymethylenebutenolidase